MLRDLFQKAQYLSQPFPVIHAPAGASLFALWTGGLLISPISMPQPSSNQVRIGLHWCGEVRLETLKGKARNLLVNPAVEAKIAA